MNQINNSERPRILLVDDDQAVRVTLSSVLRGSQFSVTEAGSVAEALLLISTQSFEVLLCDLHMPGAGDGFTVVSAMRHTNPEAITLVLTGYPALQEAMNAILMQADEILLKPMDIEAMVTLIRTKLQQSGNRSKVNTERVASILERDSNVTVANWLTRVERETELTEVPMSDELRTGHLPRLLHELVQRLQAPAQLGSKSVSKAAVLHGKMRHQQGYTVAMLVEESRILQVSIFETLQRNLSTVDFSLVLIDVMTIADEVDSQLKQAITSFMKETAIGNTA